MKESNNITYGLNIKLYKSATLYHVTQGFVDMKQDKSEPNNAFYIRFYNVYKAMELDGG